MCSWCDLVSIFWMSLCSLHVNPAGRTCSSGFRALASTFQVFHRADSLHSYGARTSLLKPEKGLLTNYHWVKKKRKVKKLICHMKHFLGQMSGMFGLFDVKSSPICVFKYDPSHNSLHKLKWHTFNLSSDSETSKECQYKEDRSKWRQKTRKPPLWSLSPPITCHTCFPFV